MEPIKNVQQVILDQENKIAELIGIIKRKDRVIVAQGEEIDKIMDTVRDCYAMIGKGIEELEENHA